MASFESQTSKIYSKDGNTLEVGMLSAKPDIPRSNTIPSNLIIKFIM